MFSSPGTNGLAKPYNINGLDAEILLGNRKELLAATIYIISLISFILYGSVDANGTNQLAVPKDLFGFNHNTHCEDWAFLPGGSVQND